MHRFVWDLHYALPKGVPSSFWGPAGPLAVPSEYTVKLTANGKSSTQPLTIKLDPRVKTPQDVLERQFGLASKIAARLGRVSVALEQVSGLRKQIDARKREAASNSDALAALEGLEKKIASAMESDSDGGFGLFGLAAPGKERESLPEVVAALTGLLITADSSDLGAASDAASASAQWDVAAQDALDRWTAFQKEELAGVNTLLEQAKLKRLVVEEGSAQR